MVVESMERGYARVRKSPTTCQLLSMLTLDPETSAIQIVKWTERFDGGGLDYFMATAQRDSSIQPAAVAMN